MTRYSWAEPKDTRKETPGRVASCWTDPFDGEEYQTADPSLQGIRGVVVRKNGNPKSNN